MGIRKVFLLSIALGSAVGAVAALLFAFQQWSALQAAQRAEHDTRLLTSALVLPEMMNMERAFINARLIAPAAATMEQWVPVQRQIMLVDTAILKTRELATSRADATALTALAAELLDVRGSALIAIAQPRIERPEAAAADFLKRMFAVQEAAYTLAVSVVTRINASNPSAGQAARLALLAWDLRDWSGRQTTTLISYIGLRLPMAGEQAEALAVYKGRIEQKWMAARAFAAAMDQPDVTAALAGVEAGYWASGGEAYATQVVPNRGKTLELDPDHFIATIRPILDTILPLRDSALKEALRQGNADIAVCQMRFLLALALLLLTACAAVVAARWFDRRVLRPTEQITTTILALAGGNHDVQVPLQGRGDELGQMAKAIEALRRHALQAEAVGHELLALQQARAEEKSRLLMELTQSHTDLAAVNLELKSLAATDALTGVPNRRSFNHVLSREWRRSQRDEIPLGLLLLDVDHFKSFNDRYGHPAGDACLVQVAAAVVSAARRPGDTAARYGGEEFAVVLPTTDLRGAVQVAELVCRAVAALNIQHDGSPIGVVTVSVGASAIVPQAAEPPEALLSAADRALYAAKHGGRNRVATPPEADPIPHSLLTTVLALGRALEQAG